MKIQTNLPKTVARATRRASRGRCRKDDRSERPTVESGVIPRQGLMKKKAAEGLSPTSEN
jgi:hypothetical protein